MAITPAEGPQMLLSLQVGLSTTRRLMPAIHPILKGLRPNGSTKIALEASLPLLLKLTIERAFNTKKGNGNMAGHINHTSSHNALSSDLCQQAGGAGDADKNAYVAALEDAVLSAEWWMADPAVAARKDQSSQRKRAVYHAADLVREQRRKAAEESPCAKQERHGIPQRVPPASLRPCDAC